MDVKINRGLAQPTQPQKKPAAPAPRSGSFAENLKAAAKPKDAAPSAEAVFAQALSDRNAPDFQKLDDFFEGLIQDEMKDGGF